jgi:hypothetical protein
MQGKKKKKIFYFVFFTWLGRPEIFSSTINWTKNSGLSWKQPKNKTKAKTTN